MKPWAVLRRVWIRLLVPSRGPLERRLWCQFRISSDQFNMVSYGVVVLGNLAGFVEVGEALKSVQGALEIVGLIEAVELL